jgi:hypothetical protein
LTANGRLKGEPIAALALARGDSIVDAARLAGIGERTLRRRLEDPGYRSQIARLRADLLSRAAGGVAEIAAKAGQVLNELLDDKSPQVRLEAIRTALDHAPRLQEITELEQRLAILEDVVSRSRLDRS